MDAKIYLVNANTFMENIFPGNENNGLVYTHYGLTSAGIRSTLLPENPIEISHYNTPTTKSIKREILDKINYDGPKIVALSTGTTCYDVMIDISKLIREKYDDACLIAGGPHFTQSDETKKEFADENNPLNAFNIGGSQPFINLCKGIIDEEIGFDGINFSGNIPPGIYYPSPDGNIAGHGYGKFPRIDSDKISEIIPNIREISGVPTVCITVPSSNTCPNNCDYCSSPQNGINGSTNSIIDIANRILKDPSLEDMPYIVDLSGNNPLRKENRKNTHQILSSIEDKGKKATYGLFLDPSLLVDKADYKYILNLVQYNDAQIDFFIGRDFIFERDAINFGRRLDGTPRNQQRLNSELEGIVRLLIDLDSHEKSTEIVMSYILSPDYRIHDFNEQAQEMLYLAAIDRKLAHPNLIFRIGMVTPYPGTQIREIYKDRIKEQPYSDYTTVANLWNNAPLLDPIQQAMELTDLFNEELAKKIEKEENILPISIVLFPRMMKEKGVDSCTMEPIDNQISRVPNYNIFVDILHDVSDMIDELSKKPMDDIYDALIAGKQIEYIS